MNYPDYSKIEKEIEQIKEYGKLKCEYGADSSQVIDKIEGTLNRFLDELKRLPEDENLAQREPSDYDEIKKLRSNGPRRLWDKLPDDFLDKLSGAFLGRAIGNVLGAPVESRPIDEMKLLANYSHMEYPPKDYWEEVPNPFLKKYGRTLSRVYKRNELDGIPIDDDLAYTVLGLFILEKFGYDFTTADVAKTWNEYLPFGFTAEGVALENYKNNVLLERIAETNNPYCQWIGADIRSDPWGYSCAGYPEKAAELAYRDAFFSHRRNGIYGEMFFSASQAAAFAVDNAVDALKIGLSEIPQDCTLYRDIKWALSVGRDLHDYKDARSAVDEKFAGMSPAHTNNNACATVFGLMVGGNDFTKVISETVAIGMDNDCTAATAGSIIGAIVGKKGIPSHWYQGFHDKIYTYLENVPELAVSDVIKRYHRQAQELYLRINGMV